VNDLVVVKVLARPVDMVSSSHKKKHQYLFLLLVLLVIDVTELRESNFLGL